MAIYREDAETVSTADWAFWRQRIQALNRVHLKTSAHATVETTTNQKSRLAGQANPGQPVIPGTTEQSALSSGITGKQSDGGQPLPHAVSAFATGKSERKTSSQDAVLHTDILQVKVWLFASVIAAMIALGLFVWLTSRIVTHEDLQVSVVSGILGVGTSLLARVFFRNYGKANEHLKHLRNEDLEQKEPHSG
jgi:hypothetical protein